MALRHCDWCSSEVPESRFCIRCGNELDADREAGQYSRFGRSVSRLSSLSGLDPSSLSGVRRAFAAAPNESVLRPSIVSTIFPQLPQASMGAFRACLGLGAATVLALGLGKLYPVALIAAAVLLPLLAIFYFYSVNIFEDNPLTIVGGTVLWGAIAGAGTALIAKALSSSGTPLFIESRGHEVLTRGVLVPLISVVLILAGPLWLLRFPRYSTVLDGATFGAASAVAFAGSEVIIQALSSFGGGLRPLGAVLPWLVKLGTIAVALPILTMAVLGAASGALWLKYRAPIRDRKALGRLGRPETALPLAAAMLIGASVVQIVLPIGAALAVIAALAVVGLLWLRRVIHVGLLEEALDIEDAPAIVCANCGHHTRLGHFCENCGISVAALPSSRSAVRPANASAEG
jgi:hypothetical protein